MKAISLWQPHGLAICLGLKPWETRNWPTSYRGPLAIHAAKRVWSDKGLWHDMAVRTLRRKLFPSVGDTETGASFCLIAPWVIYGAVLCVVDVVDCVRTSSLRGRIPRDHEFWGDFSDGDTGKGRYAWKLENLRVLPKALNWRGQQGFFEVDLGGAWEAPAASMTMDLFGSNDMASSLTPSIFDGQRR